MYESINKNELLENPVFNFVNLRQYSALNWNELNIDHKFGDYEITPLLWAIYSNKWAFANYLIKAGADINLADKNGTTPLHLAAFTGNYYICEKLLKFDANTNVVTKNGDSILHILLKSKDQIKIKKIISLLRESKYNFSKWVNTDNNDKLTPLDLSVVNNSTLEIINVLKLSASPITKANSYNIALNQQLNSTNKLNNFLISKALLDSLQFKSRDRNGQTPFKVSAKTNNYTSTRDFLNYDSDFKAHIKFPSFLSRSIVSDEEVALESKEYINAKKQRFKDGKDTDVDRKIVDYELTDDIKELIARPRHITNINRLGLLGALASPLALLISIGFNMKPHYAPISLVTGWISLCPMYLHDDITTLDFISYISQTIISASSLVTTLRCKEAICKGEIYLEFKSAVALDLISLGIGAYGLYKSYEYHTKNIKMKDKELNIILSH